MNAATTIGATPTRIEPRVLFTLLPLYIVWGSTYLAARIAVSALPAWGLAGSRYLVAGLIALAIARLRGEPMPKRQDWLFAIPAGFCLFFIGNGLIVVAVRSVPSGLAAVAAATTPLLATAMSAIRGERPTRTEVLGMALGLGGVLLLMGASAVHGWPAICLALAPIGFAFGSLLVRSRGKGGSALAIGGQQMVTGGVAMLAFSFLVGESWPSEMPWRAAAAWLYLVVFGSLVGFTAYAWLLRNARPAVAMSYAYVNPIVAVLLGAVIGGEHLGWTSALSAALIASGVMLAVTARRTRPSMDRKAPSAACENGGAE